MKPVIQNLRGFIFRKTALLLFGAALSASAHAADTLFPGQRLTPGGSITSPEGRYTLQLTLDGTLMMYHSDGALRARFGTNGLYATMQDDGNFVAYNINKVPVFNTATWGHNGARLQIQDDGNLVVYSSTNYPLWNIGAEPQSMDPRMAADVVGRELNSFGYEGWGHISLNLTGGRVIGAYQGSDNAIRIETLAQFKVPDTEYWGTASPPIPSGPSAPACYQRYCLTSASFESFEMRQAKAVSRTNCNTGLMNGIGLQL